MGRKLKKRLALLPVAIAAAFAFAGSLQAESSKSPGRDIEPFQWTKVYDGAWPPPSPATPTTGWAGRAGLQAVELRNRLYIMGGRTPAPRFPGDFSSQLWNDVWESSDLGSSWKKLPTQSAGQDMWSERAYFQAVTKGNAMYVLGGQNQVSGVGVCAPFDQGFKSCSDFYNDVWRSTDGTTWKRLTNNAWTTKGGLPLGRAGLSAIEFKGWIYVLGGSQGDDVAIGGAFPRTLFNDVWRSRDGKNWEQVTAQAPWPARAGAAVVEKNGYLYLLGGESGFFCTGPPDLLSCPYFHDVWRSRDGATWEKVTEHADWSARPGHQCQVLFDTIVCFGGFGWPTVPVPGAPSIPPFGPPLLPAHPVDVWVSRDGKDWDKLDKPPWKAAGPADGKYDFDSLVVAGGPGGLPPSIYTFGGDREVSFGQPDEKLVDDEVWRFSQPWPKK